MGWQRIVEGPDLRAILGNFQVLDRMVWGNPVPSLTFYLDDSENLLGLPRGWARDNTSVPVPLEIWSLARRRSEEFGWRLLSVPGPDILPLLPCPPNRVRRNYCQILLHYSPRENGRWIWYREGVLRESIPKL